MIISNVSLMLAATVFIFGGQSQLLGTTLAIPSATSLDPAAISRNPTVVNTEWKIPPHISFNAETNISYQIEQPNFLGNIYLFLCQTNSSNKADLRKDNTWSVAQIPVCPARCEFNTNEPQSATFTLVPGNIVGSESSNFFFCFANRGTGFEITCRSYSPLFDIFDISSSQVDTNVESAQLSLSLAAGMPTTVLALPSPVPVVSVTGVPTGSLSDASNTAAATPSSSSVTTISLTPTGTITVATVTPVSTSESGSTLGAASSKSSKLSTGAIVGIALGTLLFVAFLTLALIFFCFHRRRHRRERLASGIPERMLTGSQHDPHSQSRDLLTEKEPGHTLIHPNSNDSNFHQTVIHPNSNDSNFTDHNPNDAPIQRHSALSPYDSTPSAPYSGPAASPPRRKPIPAAVASAVSRVSRTISSSSTNPPSSPHNINSPSSAYESYHDHDTSSEEAQPRYGDARHSPQIFSGTLQAPFLSEPGMSAEEVARLEEEERRIDAAIAAAEARNGNGR